MTGESEVRYRHRRRVEFAETDMAGIVHFSNFPRFMEEAEQAFLRSIGLAVYTQWEGSTLSWPRVAVQCDFHSPARFEEVMEIAVSIERLGKRSITYRFDVSIEERRVASGKLIAACCRLDGPNGIRAIDVPDEIRQRLLGGQDPSQDDSRDESAT